MSTPRASAPRPRPAGWVARLDHSIEDLLAVLRRRPLVDRLAYGLSEAGTHSLLWHGINALDLLVGPALGHDPTRRRRALRRSIVLVIEQAVVNGPVKSAIRRERPVALRDHPHDLRTPRTSSFPSGHASAGACAATLLGADLGHTVAWYGLAALVAWSRIHVGVHHPSDVAGGAVIGLGLASTAQRLWPPPSDASRRQPPRQGSPG